jgi:hypothetical protein
MRLVKSFVRWNRQASAWLHGRVPAIFSGPSYHENLLAAIARAMAKDHPSVVLEAGGVDRPILSKSPNYLFVGLDIEKRENCNHLYDEFVIQSIEKPIAQRVDMIVSITLLEHVPNNLAAVRSMFLNLTPGGTTHHYIPSGLHPYSIALRLVGPALQKRLIPILRPGSEGVTGYPAFFDHCTPRRMERLFAKTGFTDIEITCFYRANDYFAFFTPAYIVISIFENLCDLMKWRTFASGFVISGRRPAEAIPSQTAAFQQ